MIYVNISSDQIRLSVCFQRTVTDLIGPATINTSCSGNSPAQQPGSDTFLASSHHKNRVDGISMPNMASIYSQFSLKMDC